MPYIRVAVHLATSIIILSTASVSTAVNCCTLDETELSSLGQDSPSSCPLGTFTISEVSSLSAKCDECPEGSCRLNLDCYCPVDFVEAAELHELCSYSFGESWPQSIGKEDTTWRSCTKEPSSTEATSENCCSLTTTELEERIGTSQSCPTSQSFAIFAEVRPLTGKCDRCPFGTCRVGLQCFCPKDFLESFNLQDLCRQSFGKPWSDSVDLEDTHWRSCVRPKPSQLFTFDNCCTLPPEQLEIRIGTSSNCPLFSSSTFSSVKSLSDGCDSCPHGTCRAGSECYCPHDFVLSTDQQDICRESFGMVYPNSIGKADTLCPDNPKPENLTLSPTGTVAPVGTSKPSPTETVAPVGTSKPSPTETAAPVGTSKPSSSQSSDDLLPQSGSSNAQPEGDGNKQNGSDDSNTLTSAEISGIVIGSITGIISALGVVAAWFKKGKKRSKQVASGTID